MEELEWWCDYASRAARDAAATPTSSATMMRMDAMVVAEEVSSENDFSKAHSKKKKSERVRGCLKLFFFVCFFFFASLFQSHC